MSTSVILLAGGVGTRFGSETPKQYLALKGKPLILHSLEIFLSMAEISHVSVVCHEEYHRFFPDLTLSPPGKRRQDSVANGFATLPLSTEFVLIHDGARPMITEKLVSDVLSATKQFGAAAAAVPIPFTVKEANNDCFVTKTVDRSHLWEIQTPQGLAYKLLKDGLAFADDHDLTVTDDASLCELLDHPVKLVHGSRHNIKVTTREDLMMLESLAMFTSGDRDRE